MLGHFIGKWHNTSDFRDLRMESATFHSRNSKLATNGCLGLSNKELLCLYEMYLAPAVSDFRVKTYKIVEFCNFLYPNQGICYSKNNQILLLQKINQEKNDMEYKLCLLTYNMLNVRGILLLNHNKDTILGICVLKM